MNDLKLISNKKKYYFTQWKFVNLQVHVPDLRPKDNSCTQVTLNTLLLPQLYW